MPNPMNPNYNPDLRFPEQTPLGMAYVPFQPWEQPYEAEQGFERGTMFPSLDFPFKRGAM
ncbi:MAG TPA: spore coat associated protein CotJA [Clostridiales bacterium]|nr:spore coat associated protein CotJA [Clostridiales bacterium]